VRLLTYPAADLGGLVHEGSRFGDLSALWGCGPCRGCRDLRLDLDSCPLHGGTRWKCLDSMGCRPVHEEVAVQPVPTGSRFVHKVQRLALGLPLPTEIVASALPGATRAPEHHLRLPLRAHRGHCARLCVDLQTTEKCARVCQG